MDLRIFKLIFALPARWHK